MTKSNERTSKKPTTSKPASSPKQNVSSKTAPAAKTFSKHDQIIALLKRKDGATLKEMQKVSGWQAHSVRGFLSGTVKKLSGVKLQSAKSKDGVRRYAVVS